MSPERVKIGIVGCGNISDLYFKAGKTFEVLEIAALAVRRVKLVIHHDHVSGCSRDEIETKLAVIFAGRVLEVKDGVGVEPLVERFQLLPQFQLEEAAPETEPDLGLPFRWLPAG